MNSKNIIPASILIAIGVLFLADNFDWFTFDWDHLLRFWPVLLIVLGINLIIGKRSGSATALTVLVLCVAVPAAMVNSCTNNWRWKDHDRSSFGWEHNDSNENDSNNENENETDAEDSDRSNVSQSFTEPMESGLKRASFALEGGAAKFVIDGETTSLVDAKTKLDFGDGYNLKKVLRDGTAELKLDMKDQNGNKEWNIKDDNLQNDVTVQLNPNVEWDLDFEIGAGKADFDLSKLNVNKLALKTGVTDTEIKLGDKANDASIKVESGVAQVELQIPQSVGCRIEIDGALNGKDFDGFTKIGDSYETPGYDKATKKMSIKFEGGLSSLKVKRY